MLGVNFIDEEERKISASEWVSFLQEYKLTAPEIVEAYNMTLKRQLRNEKNEVIRLFPNLSLITAGEIMEAFIKFKKDSKQYENGMNQLKLIMHPVKELTDEEKKKLMDESFEKFVQEVKSGNEGYIKKGFIYFDYLFKQGKLKNLIPDKMTIEKIQQEKMKKFVLKELLKPIFLNATEAKAMKKEIEIGNELKVHGLIRQEIKDEIVLNYIKILK